MILEIFWKTANDILHILILFPINMASLFYLPLTVYLFGRKDISKKGDLGACMSSSQYTAAQKFQVTHTF
jgi:hypothetical protein